MKKKQNTGLSGKEYTTILGSVGICDMTARGERAIGIAASGSCIVFTNVYRGIYLMGIYAAIAFACGAVASCSQGQSR